MSLVREADTQSQSDISHSKCLLLTKADIGSCTACLFLTQSRYWLLHRKFLLLT